MENNRTLRPSFPKADTYITNCQKRLWDRYAAGLSWRELLAEIKEETGGELNVSTLYLFVVDGIVPKQKRDRQTLGLVRDKKYYVNHAFDVKARQAGWKSWYYVGKAVVAKKIKIPKNPDG